MAGGKKIGDGDFLGLLSCVVFKLIQLSLSQQRCFVTRFAHMGLLKPSLQTDANVEANMIPLLQGVMRKLYDKMPLFEILKTLGKCDHCNYLPN